jgi:hypothetical protein
MRSYRVADLPLGELPVTDSATSMADVDEDTRARFGAWLLARWREKDDRLGEYYREGRLAPPGSDAVEVDLRASPADVLHLAGIMGASAIAWAWIWRTLWVFLMR